MLRVQAMRERAKRQVDDIHWEMHKRGPYVPPPPTPNPTSAVPEMPYPEPTDDMEEDVEEDPYSGEEDPDDPVNDDDWRTAHAGGNPSWGPHLGAPRKLSASGDAAANPEPQEPGSYAPQVANGLSVTNDEYWNWGPHLGAPRKLSSSGDAAANPQPHGLGPQAPGAANGLFVTNDENPNWGRHLGAPRKLSASADPIENPQPQGPDPDVPGVAKGLLVTDDNGNVDDMSDEDPEDDEYGEDYDEDDDEYWGAAAEGDVSAENERGRAARAATETGVSAEGGRRGLAGGARQGQAYTLGGGDGPDREAARRRFLERMQKRQDEQAAAKVRLRVPFLSLILCYHPS